MDSNDDPFARPRDAAGSDDLPTLRLGARGDAAPLDPPSLDPGTDPFGDLDALAPQEPLPGRVGPYLVLGRLGQGGMGTVYRALDVEAGRQVALKVLAPRADDPRRAARFRREALLAAEVRHPGLVAALACGEDGGRLYYAMELVDGPSLHDVISIEGALAPRRAAWTVARVAEAAHALHEAGVVHRDLKPANVLLDPVRGPRVVDLGLARDPRGGGITAPGEILGTVAYMAPEQALGRAVDARTDVYGLGALLYALATGWPPFFGAPAQAIARVLHDRPAPPHTINPRVPADLEALIAACMARRPEHRPDSALHVARALDAIARRPHTGRPRGRAPTTRPRMPRLAS